MSILNWKMILSGLVLLALVNGAAGYCTMITTHKDPTSEVGYRVCSDVLEPDYSDRGVDEKSFDRHDMSYFYRFREYPTEIEAVDRFEFDPVEADQIQRDHDKLDVLYGHMNIEGHNATYCTYTQRYANQSMVESSTGRFLMLEYYDYWYMGEIRILVQPTTVFTMSLTLKNGNWTQDDLVRIFESINLTNIAVTREDPLEVANQLFDQEKYEEAIIKYGSVMSEFAVNGEYYQEASDKKGIALVKLGRQNEALKWFGYYHRPISPEAWKAYGEILAKMGLNAEAEYAFIQAEEVQKESDERINESQRLQKLWEKFNPRTADQVLQDLENTSQMDDKYFALAEELKDIDPSAAVDPFIDLLLNKNVDEKTRSFAARELGIIGDPKAVDPLIQYLKEDDCGGCRQDELINVFERIGKEAVEPLIALLTDEDPKIQRGAARILGFMCDARAIEPLKGLLNSTNPDLKETTETSLASINNNLKNGICA